MIIDDRFLQLIIILSMVALLAMCLILDGEMGTRVGEFLIAGISLVLGYFFRKAQDNKENN